MDEQLPLVAREHLSEEDHANILKRMVVGKIASQVKKWLCESGLHFQTSRPPYPLDRFSQRLLCAINIDINIISIFFAGGHNRVAGLERVQPHHGHLLPAGREEAAGAEARSRKETETEVTALLYVV